MEILRKNWWIAALQGVFLLGAGVLTVLDIVNDLPQLIEFLGLIFLAFGGILGLWSLRLHKKGSHWGWMFFIAFIEVALGLIILANPNGSIRIFLYVIGGFALLIGLIQLIIGFMARHNKMMFFINSFISLVFGALIIWKPFEEPHTLTYTVGIYSVILGFTFIFYSFKIRRWGNKRHSKTEKKNQEINTPANTDPGSGTDEPL